MAYDTIKLRSPYMDRHFVRQVEEKCILRSGQDMASGEIIYELFTGQLLGSWDARISVVPKYDEFIADARGKVRCQPCEPYLLVEASVHKVQYGHNIYGGPTKFLQAARDLVALLEKLLEVDMPSADVWTVHRVDVANVFALTPAAIKQFFQSVHLMDFPRRGKKAMRTANSLYFPGKTTTVKFYHKGPEFKVHDYARLRSFFKVYFQHIHGSSEGLLSKVDRKLAALQRLADRRLRVEVEVHSDKLQYDFGRNPTCAEVTDEYFTKVHDDEIERVLREGKQGMETVRTNDAVCQRLHNHYGRVVGNRLHGFWQTMCTSGDEKTKARYTKPTFYRNRKLLEDAGVSWRGSDIVIVANDSLIHDFSPVRADRRFCSLPARNRPEYHVSRDLMRLAA